MSANTYNLTTKSLVKSFLRITGTDDDDLIDSLCNWITAFIEKEIGSRRIKLTTYTQELYDGTPKQNYLRLKNYPITSWDKLEYNSGTSKTPAWVDMDRDDYETYDLEGTLYWNKIYDGVRNIRISYKAGYSTIPGDLEMLATKLVARAYDKRTSEQLNGESQDGVNLNWGDFLREEDKKVLDNYKRSIIV